MPREDANAYTLSQIAQDSVELVYFVHIGWDIGGGQEYRINNTDSDISDPAGPYVYRGVGCRVNAGDYSEIGNSPRVIVADENKIVRSYIDTQGLEVVAEIWQAYFNTRTYGTWNFANTIKVFSGIVSGAPRIGLLVELELTQPIDNRLVPHIQFIAPTCNWNAKPGTRIDFWGGEIEVNE